MMRKPMGHKERYVIKSEVARSNDGTSARTRGFSFDEVMLSRKTKTERGVVSEVGLGSHVESDKYRRRDDEREQSLKGSTRAKEDSAKVREEKMVGRRVVSEVDSGSRLELDIYKRRDGGGEGERYDNKERLNASSRTKEDWSTVRGYKIVDGDNKKDHRVVSEVVTGRAEGVSGEERYALEERLKMSSRMKVDRAKVREEKLVDGEYKADQRVLSAVVSEKGVEGGAGRVGSDRNVSSRTKEDGSTVRGDKLVDGENKKIQRVVSEVVSSRAEGVPRRVDSDRYRHRGVAVDERYKEESLKASSRTKDDRSKVKEDKTVEGEYKESVGGSEKHVSKERLEISARMNDDRSNVSEDKRVEVEYRESDNAHRRSKIGSDDVKDRWNERVVHEKRKNPDRPTDDFDNEHDKRRAKDSAVKDRDRNVERKRNAERDRNVERDRYAKMDRYDERHVGKSEHVSKRTENGYDERDRVQDTGKKLDLRKEHDSNTSETKQKEASESRHGDSRSREHEREKRRRSRTPSPRGNKQRAHDVREHEDSLSHASKDRVGRSDTNSDRNKLSNNGSNNKSKRHDTSASRLGGYSPRKRRSDAAVRTPSPNSRSPEKKKAGWDSPPVKAEGKYSSSSQSDLPSLSKTELPIKREMTTAVPFTPIIPKTTFGALSGIPSLMNASVDSIQLTQATRPKRRIYVENLPSSASEADVMKWLSGYLRPAAFNIIQGPSPCISCIVNKEKGQALVEFLTPEDASTALSFDGKSFSGNIVKIRRPKDYVEANTGVLEKPLAGAVSVRSIVEDSVNKIFIGGISKVITSEMLMEVASTFGPLKAYRFEDNAHLGSPCAFVEYADHLVTVKACAALNGMKLGGQLLTVTQATPATSSVENHGEKLLYGTPLHARPLLETPTQVLKLNNVMDPESLISLSESELEEILEDIRLECARFGMVKSINIIKQTNIPTSRETVKTAKESDSMVDEVNDDHIERGSHPSGSDQEQHEEVVEPADGNKCDNDKQDETAPIGITDEPEKVNGSTGVNGIIGKKYENNSVKDETCDTTMVDGDMENQNSNQISSAIDQLELNDNKSELERDETRDTTMVDSDVENQNLNQMSSSIDQLESNDNIPTDDIETENTSMKLDMVIESNDPTKDVLSDLNDTFEVGCVLVEYKRTEASSVAAHCLHGRIFDGRTVSVEYVAHDVYRTRFHK